jgi:hypothetical protein
MCVQEPCVYLLSAASVVIRNRYTGNSRTYREHPEMGEKQNIKKTVKADDKQSVENNLVDGK